MSNNNKLKPLIFGLTIFSLLVFKESNAAVEFDLLNDQVNITEDSNEDQVESSASIDKKAETGFFGKIADFFDKKNPSSNVITYNYKIDESYIVRIKNGVSTIINFPENERIVFYSVGKSNAIEIRHNKEIPNILNLKPITSIIQTNLVVKTDIGSVYNFYLTTEDSGEGSQPSFTVYITKDSGNDLTKSENLLKSLKENNSYIKKVKNLDKLNTSYKIKGDREIAPLFVYDDGKWTYFDFGKNFVSDRLPNAYKVIDSFDSVVNTRSKGNLLIATSLSVDGWTLKNGDKYVCIRPKKSLYEVYKDERYLKNQ